MIVLWLLCLILLYLLAYILRFNVQAGSKPTCNVGTNRMLCRRQPSIKTPSLANIAVLYYTDYIFASIDILFCNIWSDGVRFFEKFLNKGEVFGLRDCLVCRNK